MPTLVTEQGIVHYEAYGRGRPVILLHGWLGSWALWRETIEELGKHYRTYALDFFGFGESMERSADFKVSTYVELVSQFMDKLGIVKAPLVGHSMGGTVALSTAARYPEKVVKVAVIGSPIQGKSLNFILRMSGYRGIAHMAYNLPFVLDMFLLALTRFGSRDGAKVHRMVKTDASRVALEPFFQSIGTLRDTDLTGQLETLKVPILGMYGKRDLIVHPNQSQVLREHAPDVQEAWFDDAGHFIMIDRPDRFVETLNAFLQRGTQTGATPARP